MLEYHSDYPINLISVWFYRSRSLIHIGLYDTDKNVYAWKDGQPYTVCVPGTSCPSTTRWNSYQTDGQANYNCVMMTSNFFWTAQPCLNYLKYLCQYQRLSNGKALYFYYVFVSGLCSLVQTILTVCVNTKNYLMVHKELYLFE